MTSGMPNPEATVVIFYIAIVFLICYVGFLFIKVEKLEEEIKRLKNQ